LYLKTSGVFESGQEYGFAYSNSFQCASLISTYGFAVKDGLAEEVYLKFENIIPRENFELCEKLKCTDYSNNLKNTRLYMHKLSNLGADEEEEKFLKMYRIKNYELPETENSTEYTKVLNRAARVIENNMSNFEIKFLTAYRNLWIYFH